MTAQLFRCVKQRLGLSMGHETTLDFLARSGRPEAVEIRQWMEKWFQRFPEDHRAELKTRFQSDDFAKFMGAYFELQVFAMLRHIDCDVEVHPDFAGTGGTVDFCVTHGDDKCYVEATVCGINRGILRSNTNEEDAVRKIVDAIEYPHSDIWLDAEGELCTTLGRDRLANPINELLNSSSTEDVRDFEDGYSLRRPRTLIQEDGWRLEVSLSSPIASHGNGQVWGPSRGGCVDGVSPVAKALSKKAKDWANKRLEGETFIIAINNCHSEYRWGDERRAIYANPDPMVDQDAFRRPLSRVSGVIGFGNATLGHERTSPVKLFDNPVKCAPECLRFLSCETSLGRLIGFG